MIDSSNPLKLRALHPPGITLIELLAGIAITSIVLFLAGSGLVRMTAVSQESKQSTQSLLKLNRTLDYLSNDMRESLSLENPNDGMPDTFLPSNWENPDGYTPIVYLKKPFRAFIPFNADPNDNRAASDDRDTIVAYYTRATSSDDPSTALDDGWKSDQVLYRQVYDGTQFVLVPILDGLSNTEAPCELPPAIDDDEPTIAGENGFRVNIGMSHKKIMLCLQTRAEDAETLFLQTATVSLRNNPENSTNP